MAVLQPFEIWENETAGVRYCLSYISSSTVTGALMVKANFELPQRTSEGYTEGITQVAGQCSITTVNAEGEITAAYELGPGDWLELPAGTESVITNAGEDESVSLFRLEGECQPFLDTIRSTYVRIEKTAAPRA